MTLYLSQRSSIKKTSLTEIYFLSRTNKTLIRGATLIHGMTRALSRIPTYPRQMTSACNVAEYFVKSHLTAPSAVHLTTCFLPDSQQHRLSVKASLPLYPLQRFELLTFYGLYYSTHISDCQYVTFVST